MPDGGPYRDERHDGMADTLQRGGEEQAHPELAQGSSKGTCQIPWSPNGRVSAAPRSAAARRRLEPAVGPPGIEKHAGLATSRLLCPYLECIVHRFKAVS